MTIGATTGLTAKYLDSSRGWFPFASFLTVPGRQAALVAYDEEMTRKRVKINYKLMDYTAWITDWVVYLSLLNRSESED